MHKQPIPGVRCERKNDYNWPIGHELASQGLALLTMLLFSSCGAEEPIRVVASPKRDRLTMQHLADGSETYRTYQVGFVREFDWGDDGSGASVPLRGRDVSMDVAGRTVASRT